MTDHDDHHEERLAQFFLFTPDFTIDIYPDLQKPVPPFYDDQAVKIIYPPSMHVGFDFGDRLSAVAEFTLPVDLPEGTVLRVVALRREIPNR